MSVEERELHELHNGWEKVLGPDRAATLMSRLSPVAGAEVATRTDLRTLGDVLRLEMAAQGDKLRAEVVNQISRQTWVIVVAFVMAVAAVAGLS